MKKPLTILSAAISLFVMAAFSVSAQQSYIGPLFTYTVSTSISNEVSAYGAPVRFGVGGRYSRVLSNGAEIYGGLLYRIESGGFLSTYSATSSVRVSKLDVVDPITGNPAVSSAISSGSLELNGGIGFRVAKLDTIGSGILINLGLFGDRILVATQTDDYSSIPPDQLGSKPVTVVTNYNGQFGFGIIVGASLVMPMGDGRLVFDIGYMMRVPTTIDAPNPEQGKLTQQNITWLVSRGLRMGLTYQLGL